MSTRNKTALTAALVSSAAVVALTWAGLVWACVPQPLLTVVPQASGPPGAQVTVQGFAFGPARVEIRWNSLDGPLLTTVQGPQVSAAVTIPEAPEGLYSILAFERGADGAVGSSGRAAFQVTSAGRSSPEASTPAATAPTESVVEPPSTSSSSSGVSLGAASFVGALLLAVGIVVGSLLRDGRGRIRSPSGTGQPPASG